MLASLANGCTFAATMKANLALYCVAALPVSGGVAAVGALGHHHHLWGAGLCAGC
jgi:hypothetical protein